MTAQDFGFVRHRLRLKVEIGLVFLLCVPSALDTAKFERKGNDRNSFCIVGMAILPISQLDAFSR